VPIPFRNLLQSARQEPVTALAWLLVLVACVWPLWASGLLPFMDLPQHLATVRVLHSYNDPSYGVSHYFAIELGRTQYLAWYFLVDWLTYLMPLEIAARVVFSLYALGLPLSIAVLLKAHGRDSRVALLAAPFVYNPFLFMGFANYVTALPLIFWGLALLQESLDAFSWRRLPLLIFVTTLCFYDHAMAFLMYVALAGMTVLLGARGLHPRHWWRQALHLAPAALAMLWWTSQSLILAGADEWHKGMGGRNVAPVDIRFKPLLERFTSFPEFLLDAYPDDADEKLFIAWLVILGLAWIIGRDALNRRGLTGREALRAHVPEAMLVTSTLIYLASPISYKWIWPIADRLVPIVALLALPALARQSTPYRTFTLVIPATILALTMSHTHAKRAQEFTTEAGPIREVVAQADRGKKLMALIYQPQSRVMKWPAFLHFGQYYTVERGGMANFSFANFPQSPVLFPDQGGPPKVPPRFEWTPEVFSMQDQGYWYDYFLIRDENPNRNPFGAERNKVELVVRKGPWALWKQVAARPK
jgi:hypothetical protein